MTEATLFLRTVNEDHQSYGGFQWPREVGAVVVAPDWSERPECGGGLHGLPWGRGDLSLLGGSNDAIWQVVSAVEFIDIDGDKSKFRSCTLEYIGDQSGAIAFMRSRAPAGVVLPFEVVVAGNKGTATAGDEGTATAGYRGTATAGNKGTAAAGDGGTAAAGYRGTATAGYRGTATAGDGGTATAGGGGVIVIAWHDGTRGRLAVGYVGEDGIEADVAYKVDGHGDLVKK